MFVAIVSAVRVSLVYGEECRAFPELVALPRGQPLESPIPAPALQPKE
jgi:hypothetical protein